MTGGDVYQDYLRVVRELLECDRLSVDDDVVDNDGSVPTEPGEVRRLLTETLADPVAARLQRSCFDQRQLHVEWSSTGDPHVHGEFCLENPLAALTEWYPALSDPVLASRDRRVLASLKLVDQEPSGGTGRVAGMRVVDAGRDPELWFYDMPHRILVKLEINYVQYLEAVFTLRGASGWQFLFADVDLREPMFGSDVENLTAAFNLFYELFPDDDYSDLRARLEARL